MNVLILQKTYAFFSMDISALSTGPIQFFFPLSREEKCATKETRTATIALVLGNSSINFSMIASMLLTLFPVNNIEILHVSIWHKNTPATNT